MKVLKPFNRGGQHYPRGSAAPADLDKATIAHYRRHGMVGGEDLAGASAAPAAPSAPAAPARRGRQAGPSETKPTGPSETKPAAPSGATADGAGASGTPAAGEGSTPPITAGITSDSLKFPGAADMITGDAGKDVGQAAGPSLPLGA